MMGTTRKALLPLLAGTILLAGCDDSLGGDDARLSIRLTDAPGDLSEAWVRVDRIYLQGGEAEGAEEAQGGRIDLLDAPTGWIDLLTLAGGTTAELVDGEIVPAGDYSELRFVVCDAWIRTEDGTVYATSGADLPAGVTADGELRAPSACQSGFKVKFPDGGVHLDNDSQILVVDFDVAQSFGKQAGKSGAWVMHPVLHATDVEFSGGVAGTVALADGVTLPACGGATPDLTAFVPLAIAGDTTSGQTQADGAFQIAPLAPGDYSLSHDDVVGYENGDTLRIDAGAQPASVTVTSGGSASAAYTVTGATCQAAGG